MIKLLLACLLTLQFAEGRGIQPGPDTAPKPTPKPTAYPSNKPTTQPSQSPTNKPPTGLPSAAPTTSDPTPDPSQSPSLNPSASPTSLEPTFVPSPSPTGYPTRAPTSNPSDHPTTDPTASPTTNPTKHPTSNPTTWRPTQVDETRPPTPSPTAAPTKNPTHSPTGVPSVSPTSDPTVLPTKSPTSSPTQSPTAPSGALTVGPTVEPTLDPTISPTVHRLHPSALPTLQPSNVPSEAPSAIALASDDTGDDRDDDGDDDDDQLQDESDGSEASSPQSASRKIREQTAYALPFQAFFLLVTVVLFVVLCVNLIKKSSDIKTSIKIVVSLTFVFNAAAIVASVFVTIIVSTSEQWTQYEYDKSDVAYNVLSVCYVLGKLCLDVFFVLRAYNSFAGSAFALSKCTLFALCGLVVVIAAVWMVGLVLLETETDLHFVVVSVLDALFMSLLLFLFTRRLTALVLLQKTESICSESSMNTSTMQSVGSSADSENAPKEAELSRVTSTDFRLPRVTRQQTIQMVKEGLSRRQTRMIEVITKAIILCFAAMSTTIAFGIFAFYYTRYEVQLFMVYICWTADMCVNCVCLYLNFVFAKKIYGKCCACCHLQCQKWLQHFAARQLVNQHFGA